MIDHFLNMSKPKLLMTAACLGYSFIPLFFTLDHNHIGHPDWPPHSRFHVVWQVISFSLLGILVLWLIWSRAGHLGIAAIISAIILGSYILAAALDPLFGGTVLAVERHLEPFAIAYFLMLFLLNLLGLWLAHQHRATSKTAIY